MITRLFVLVLLSTCGFCYATEEFCTPSISMDSGSLLGAHQWKVARIWPP